MNIISNSCVGGHLYKNNLKTEFKNPFIWEIIDFNSMYYMIKNWGKINWKNYELKKDKHWNFSIVVDNNITIRYVHYRFDRNAKKMYKEKLNVFSNKIWKYIVKKYEDRLARMLFENEKPIFIFADRWCRNDTKLDDRKLKLLNDLQQDNIICAVDKKDEKLKYIKQVICNPKEILFNDILADKIYNEILVKEFIK